MTVRIVKFEVTTPAGTPLATPITTALAVPQGIVTAIEWHVPPGPSGNLGWALAYSGQQVIPWNAGEWIIADDASDTWVIENLPTFGDWAMTSYNTGTYDHTVYLRFLLDPVSSAPATPVGSGIITIT